MRVATIIAACATLAAAAPKGYHPPKDYHHKQCLTNKIAKELVYATTEIFTSNDPTELVLKYFTKDYHQYSDSTSFTVDPSIAPALSEPFTTSRKQFLMQHVGFNEGNPGFSVEDYFYDCDKITFRWVWNWPDVPVRGIDVMECVYSKSGWRIKTDYAEFNNIALLANFGICPGGPCPAPAAAEE